MPERPYTVLSCCMSLDGYLDDSSPRRLVLSGEADLDRIDALRAGSDAILVGATTIRCDNPRLLVRSAERRSERVAAGLPATPAKVTVTSLAKLDPGAAFFTSGETRKLVYCTTDTVATADESLGQLATVVDAGQPVTMRRVSEDLHDRGVRRLLVEGGGSVHSQFLAEDVADEMQVAVAPFFVGDAGARRFVDPGHYPWTARRRAELAGTTVLGDIAVLRYALSARFCPDH